MMVSCCNLDIRVLDEKCLQVSIQRQPDNVDLQSLLEAQLIILVALKIAGRLHETALDAATKGNRYIHSCLRYFHNDLNVSLI
ncbi:uncharacterized protein LOC108819339 isoform X2 [Raphanus sativus]|uniref:Uncharacterized protein LOC108819339 isoform X2 n=1 Tax=Raphanus sativus TaxID=3726 RepID=A0A9W3CD38_RAPSA|nr:uncharacterized protein LOC108819339 isoform X2 [Raphanus sativus]